MRPPDAEPRGYHLFLRIPDVWAGVPFSEFLQLVLEARTMHLVQLTPNAVITLAILVHAYEMFVGV